MSDGKKGGTPEQATPSDCEEGGTQEQATPSDAKKDCTQRREAWGEFRWLVVASLAITATSIAIALFAAGLLDGWDNDAIRVVGLVMLGVGLSVALYAAGVCAVLAWKVADTRVFESR